MDDTTKNIIKTDEDNEDESIITMVDVLEEENKLEADAFAVLGASDDMNCTYNKGYVNRQALYACKTCCDNNNKSLAGLCLACSYHCHEGHDLVELYTKRNFRCDCGNSLFGGKKCNLLLEKEARNFNNSYNQNFKGVYCTCARPYPDPEDNTLDEMIQCIVCEDWYHTRHLIMENSSAVPAIDDYSEMICHFCTDRLSSPFLKYYKGYSVTKIKSESSGGDCDDIVIDDGAKLVTNLTCDENRSESVDVTNSSGGDVAEKSNVNCRDDCKLKSIDKMAVIELRGASFWRDEFRYVLCKCKDCTELYKSHGVNFLADPSDTVQAYEEEGEKRRNKRNDDEEQGSGSQSGYEQGLKALSTLDRTKQVEAIHRYNEMQEHLKAYLAKFAENKKVVRAEDIKEFFSEMQSRKRQKVDLPYFCH